MTFRKKAYRFWAVNGPTAVPKPVRWCLCLLLVVAARSGAQPPARGVVLLHYALDSFSAGTVLMKDGSSSAQVLNYNTLTGEMIFVSGSQYLAIAAPQDVDTVFIGPHKFVPVAKKFCEWLGGAEPALFKEYSCTVKEPGVEAGFGKTNTTAASSLNTLIRSGSAYNLTLPGEFELLPGVTYYLRSKGKFYKLTAPQQAAKALPAKKAAVEEWLKTHPAKFTDDGERVLFVKAIQAEK